MIKVDCATIEFWKHYVSRFKQSNKKVPVTMSTYRKIIGEYNKEISRQLLEGKTYKIPYRLGYFSIIRRPTMIGTIINNKHALKIDFKATKEEGKVIYHMNEHTEYQFCQVYWFRPSLRSQKYIFKPCRELSRGISNSIKNNPNHYKNFRLFINQDRHDI